jgi:hypothetical protein
MINVERIHLHVWLAGLSEGPSERKTRCTEDVAVDVSNERDEDVTVGDLRILSQPDTRLRCEKAELYLLSESLKLGVRNPTPKVLTCKPGETTVRHALPGREARVLLVAKEATKRPALGAAVHCACGKILASAEAAASRLVKQRSALGVPSKL